MSKEGVAVAVDPESDKVITEKGEGETEDAQTVLTIPAGAVSTATDVTPYSVSGSCCNRCDSGQ